MCLSHYFNDNLEYWFHVITVSSAIKPTVEFPHRWIPGRRDSVPVPHQQRQSDAGQHEPEQGHCFSYPAANLPSIHLPA